MKLPQLAIGSMRADMDDAGALVITVDRRQVRVSEHRASFELSALQVRALAAHLNAVEVSGPSPAATVRILRTDIAGPEFLTRKPRMRGPRRI